jgi:tRNA pseudouridine55 synthase
VDGVILVDKPAGKTSHDVVAAVRRGLGRRRVGHAGTLDPFATGLLIVLVGRATRAQRFFMALPKTYRVVARLGAVSSTGDPEGAIEVTGVMPADPLPLPTGRILQRPPAHSAVKVDGERAYRRARRGEAVDTPEREVEVYRFEAVGPRGDDRVELEVECSAGTYVRSLVADLGDAYCESLRRTAIGPFRVQDADGRTLIGLDEALRFLPECRLDAEAARRASHGGAVPGEAEGPVRLTDEAGLVAIAESRDGALRPVVGFRAS